MLLLLASDPALPLLLHTTTKFPAPLAATEGESW